MAFHVAVTDVGDSEWTRRDGASGMGQARPHARDGRRAAAPIQGVSWGNGTSSPDGTGSLVILNVALTAYLLRVPRGAGAPRWLAGFTAGTAALVAFPLALRGSLVRPVALLLDGVRYCAPEHFSKQFRKAHGVTPSTYADR